LIVVSDTSPIRALHHLNVLDVLGELFGRVLVPPTVAAELNRAAPRWRPVDVSNVSFVTIQAPRDQKRVTEFLDRLDLGEAEAIALALEQSIRPLLIDESVGRQIARSHGLIPVGTLGILQRAKSRGMIQAAVPLVDRLRNEINFFVSDELREEFRKRVAE